MNLPGWSFALSPLYPPSTPANYYSYPYMPSPYTISTTLNSSSGYESANTDTSFIDPCFPSPSSNLKKSHYDSIYQPPPSVTVQNTGKRQYDQIDVDEDTDDSMSMINDQNGRKKRRVLSRPQRQEANRRERNRMEVINEAYEQLRNVLPFKKGRKRQKMSRMDTVDGAVQYIHSLLETLHGPNYDPNWAK